MSLINDALKRARESQAKAPPPPPASLEFRPVELAQMAHPGPSLALIATVCVAIVLAGLLLWQFLRKSPAPVPVASAPAGQQAPPTAAVPSPVAVAPVAAPASAPVSPPAKVPVPASVDPKAVIAAAPEASAPGAPAPPTAAVQVASAAPAVELAPAKPAPPKLQAIVFRKTRPSAMISGKTLFVGDKFGDWRLVAITEETATLVGAGITNVLVLPQ